MRRSWLRPGQLGCKSWAGGNYRGWHASPNSMLTIFIQLDAAGIRPSTAAKRLQKESYRGWAVGLTFSTLSGLYTLYLLNQRESGISKEDGESAVEGKKIAKCVYIFLSQVLSRPLYHQQRGGMAQGRSQIVFLYMLNS